MDPAPQIPSYTSSVMDASVPFVPMNDYSLPPPEQFQGFDFVSSNNVCHSVTPEADNNDPSSNLPAKSKPSLFKTRLCALFTHGKCMHGSNCNFAHSNEELQGSPDLRKTSLCVEYMQTGRCRREHDCRFAHGYGELRHTAEVFKTSLCTFWEYGNCQYGNFCRHAHGIKELRTVEENRRNFSQNLHQPSAERTSSTHAESISTSNTYTDSSASDHSEPAQYSDFKNFDAGLGSPIINSQTESPQPLVPDVLGVPVAVPPALPLVGDSTWSPVKAPENDWDSPCLLGGGGCARCGKNDATHIIVPCGHQCVCEECRQNLESCPVCSTQVSACVKVIHC